MGLRELADGPAAFNFSPLLGPEVLPKDAMRQRIREFLLDQLNDEKGLTAALIIHTLNKDQEKVGADGWSYGY